MNFQLILGNVILNSGLYYIPQDPKYTYHLVNAHLLYAKFGLRGILDYSLKNCINAKIIPLTRFYYKHFVHNKKRIIAMCFIEVDDLALNGQVMPVIQTKISFYWYICV